MRSLAEPKQAEKCLVLTPSLFIRVRREAARKIHDGGSDKMAEGAIHHL